MQILPTQGPHHAPYACAHPSAATRPQAELKTRPRGRPTEQNCAMTSSKVRKAADRRPRAIAVRSGPCPFASVVLLFLLQLKRQLSLVLTAGSVGRFLGGGIIEAALACFTMLLIRKRERTRKFPLFFQWGFGCCCQLKNPSARRQARSIPLRIARHMQLLTHGLCDLSSNQSSHNPCISAKNNCSVNAGVLLIF